jgi:hypothetical protein
VWMPPVGAQVMTTGFDIASSYALAAVGVACGSVDPWASLR